MYKQAVNKDAFLEDFNVSGLGGVRTYDNISCLKLKMNGSFTSQKAAQVAYHCVFGTFKEDFGILSQTANCKTWFQRNQFGESFQGWGTSEKTVEFNPIKLKFWAKLSSANQTGMFASSHTQFISCSVMSGKRSIRMSEQFFDSLQSKTGTNLSSLS